MFLETLFGAAGMHGSMYTHGLIMYRHVIGSLAGPGQFLDNCRVFATPNNGRTPRGGCGEGPPDSHSEPRVRGVRLVPFGSMPRPWGQRLASAQSLTWCD